MQSGKKKLLKRAASVLLTAALVLGMIVTDLPIGTGIIAQAANDHSKFVTGPGDWGGDGTRTTTWSFTGVESDETISNDSTVATIKNMGATVSLKATSGSNPECLSVKDGSIGIPIDRDTEKITLTMTLVSGNKDRYLEIEGQSDKIWHSNSDTSDGSVTKAQKEKYFSSNSYTGEYTITSDISADGYLTVTAAGIDAASSTEVKFGTITLVETKGDGSGGGETDTLKPTPIGQSEKYSFYDTHTVFGEETVAADTPILSPKNYIQLVSKGELTSPENNNHGLIMKGETTFTALLPAHAQGEFKVYECQYASCSGTLKVDGNAQQDQAGVGLAGADDKTGTETFEYKNTSDKEVEMSLVVTASTGYIHGIEFSVSEIVEEITVSGTVESVTGGTLTFTPEGGGTAKTCTVNSDGSYSVQLAIGKKYTVTLANDSGWKLVNATLDLTSAKADENLTGQNFTPVCWKSDKSFAVTIGGTKFTVTPGAAEGDDFSVTAENGDGHVELATATTALVWANLQGSGQGSLSSRLVEADDTVTTNISGNTLTVTYNDKDTLPTSYTLEVKDNSASGTPYATGETLRYDFTDGSVISKLYAQGSKYSVTGGASVSSTDKLVTLTGNARIFYNAAAGATSAHGISIGAGDTIEIKVAGNAEITFSACQYTGSGGTITASTDSTTGTIDTTARDFKAATDGAGVTYSYTDANPATLTFTIGGATSYLHSLTVVNEAEATTTNPDAATVVPTADRVGNKDNLTITPAGQSLTLKQTDGEIDGTNTGKDSNNNSLYLFPETAEYNVLELDVVVNSATSGNGNGIWVGAFDKDQNMMTLAVRAGTGLTQYYTKADTAEGKTNNGTSSNVSGTVPLGTSMHYKMYKSSDSKFYIEISYLSDGELVTKTASFNSSSSSYKLLQNGIDTPVYYGIAVCDANVTITNMVYKDKDGKILYDQNTYYNPIGVAPVPTEIFAEVGATKEYIDVSWTGDACVGDGKYVLEVSRDGTKWEQVAINLTTQSYQYAVSSEDSGDFYFRVTGVLGMNVLPGADAKYVTVGPVEMVAALDRPVISLSTGEGSVTVSWNAVSGATSYKVYRYSFDEGEDNAQVIADNVTTTSYTDKTAAEEMPYYYYVTAHSSDNFSNPSNTEWTLLISEAAHTGEYVYEDEAVGITITSKSYDTVFNGKITLEGVIEKAGNVSLWVNGTEAAKQDNVGARGTFSFKDIDIQQGRNDVNLIVTDANGKKTRKTFNFVYLTNYDIVVDATYTGTDGDKVNDIPTYKTVQAAVNSVSSGNSSRVIILVKEGSYEENLQVTSPYITLIGEDSEKTVIHYLTTSTSMGANGRAAIYVDSKATGFSAENLTFENDYAFKGSGDEQKDALDTRAKNAVYVNVRLLGYQDTLCANSGPSYYYKCYITGNVDFIYGNEPEAYFNDCQLVFRASAKNSGYVVAPKTGADKNYGLTFYNCQVLSEAGCSGSSYYLARPWGADAYVTWINCYMGKVLKPNTELPYADMSGNSWQLARFYEYGSYGPAFAVNVNRRQISENKANEMRTAGYLGWDPEANTGDIGKLYIGSIVTETEDKLVSNEYKPDTYLETEGDDTGLGKYRMEGFAQTAGVTGGGLLHETGYAGDSSNGVQSENYYTAKNAEEFLTALVAVKTSGMPSVIELTGDINLGPNEVPNYANYKSVIEAHGHQPLTHPTLLQTGMSKLSIRDMGNLTIYSSNGSSIKHACIDIYNSTNIIIRNIVFDECWEWDEDTWGDYDTNDWDYMTIEKGSADIWIDHCTFYKAYDGVIDSKTPVANSNTTISWCEFLPGSEGDVFFDDMMKELEANPSKYPYYQSLLDSGMSKEQIRGYAYGQKKTHLYGQSVESTDAKNLTLTLANNYYYNSMDRMPRIRYGTAHVYNCVMNAQELRETRMSITNAEEAKRIVSNGASSTCGAHVLLENCVISGITNALNSGNGSDPAGYINAVNTLYYLDGIRYKLEPKVNTSYPGATVLLQDPDEFTSALPYSNYVLYDPAKLQTEVVPYVGAGKMTDWTVLQWEKTAYYDPEWEEPDEIPNYDDDDLPDYEEIPSDDTNSGDEDQNQNVENPGNNDNDDDDDDDMTLQEEAIEGKIEAVEKDASGNEVRRLTNRNMQHVISIVGASKVLPSGAYYTSQYQTSGSHYDRAVEAVKSRLVECSDFRVIDINLYDANNVAIHQLGKMVNVELRMPDGFKVRDGYVIVVYRLNDNGTLTKCNTSVNGNTITFQTNHFSTFIIAEQTTAGAARTPSTGDDSNMAGHMAGLILAMFAMAVLAVVYVKKFRKQQ